ncbi:MAG: hypothetical protein KDB14_08880 [Planctomycetales bacterium]|nr:hypothetical protein [Planctomycetales bacterium]
MCDNGQRFHYGEVTYDTDDGEITQLALFRTGRFYGFTPSGEPWNFECKGQIAGYVESAWNVSTCGLLDLAFGPDLSGFGADKVLISFSEYDGNTNSYTKHYLFDSSSAFSNCETYSVTLNKQVTAPAGAAATLDVSVDMTVCPQPKAWPSPNIPTLYIDSITWPVGCHFYQVGRTPQSTDNGITTGNCEETAPLSPLTYVPIFTYEDGKIVCRMHYETLQGTVNFWGGYSDNLYDWNIHAWSGAYSGGDATVTLTPDVSRSIVTDATNPTVNMSVNMVDPS